MYLEKPNSKKLVLFIKQNRIKNQYIPRLVYVPTNQELKKLCLRIVKN